MPAYGLIYVLIDPRDERIRYVGQTTIPLAERLRLHMSKQSLEKDAKSATWLRELRAAGKRPEIVPVAAGINAAHLDALEVAFVQHLLSLGCELMNTHGGGRMSHAPDVGKGGAIGSASTAAGGPLTLARQIMQSDPVKPVPTDPPKAVPRARRVALVREMLREGKSLAAIIEWLQNVYPGRPDAEAKAWKVSRAEAGKIIGDAQLQNALGDIQSSDKKKSERRAVYELLLERAISRNTIASDLLAVKINQEMCRIDNVYEAIAAPLSNGSPLSVEDAIETIAHGQAMLELARQRGVIPASSTVIDAEATESEDDEIDDEGIGTESAN